MGKRTNRSGLTQFRRDAACAALTGLLARHDGKVTEVGMARLAHEYGKAMADVESGRARKERP